MPITWTVDAAKGRVHVTLTIPSTRDQARAAATNILSAPGYAPTFGFVVDAIGKAGPEFVRDVVHFFATHRDKFRGVRVAIVMTLGSVPCSKSKLAETLAQGRDLPMTIETFRTYKAAERWLSSTI
ncbi:MAG: hypothetical protein DMF84_22255 [Acidobacteria bacterium]|nr:MAG: hypothetical protein DMF84_22255 [Acidobacteriota bacterium]